jgi:murein DD-endopeptidase MepM/ murein hydrolase activator NlpD
VRRAIAATFAATGLAAAVAGCSPAHRPVEPVPDRVPAQEIPGTPAAPAPPARAAEAENEGVFHIVQPGQTLWRIARAYGVSLETIAKANGIVDPSNVAAGTPIFVPGAAVTLDIAPWPAPPPAPGAAPRAPAPSLADLLWPVSGGEMMRPFGEPRPHHTHAGIDIRGALGQQILAAHDGTVAFSGPTRGGYGNMVVVDHGNGVETVYAHAQKLLVKTGDAVTRGEPIAQVGHTGNATADHCHFELRRADVPVDPIPYFVSVAEVQRR